MMTGVVLDESRRFHHEIDVDGVVGKHDFAVFGFIQQPGVQQRANVAMHGLDIAPGPPRRFADRHRSGAGQDLEQLPAFRRQRLPEFRVALDDDYRLRLLLGTLTIMSLERHPER